MPASENITELLLDLHGGDESVISRLLPQIRTELRRIAQFMFNKEGAAYSVDPSDLVQETTLRLLRIGAGPWIDREHFFAVAALDIRRQLVDRARRRKAKKRGGGTRPQVLTDDAAYAQDRDASQFLDVNRTIRRLEVLNKRQGQIVVLRFFTGMTVEETAKALGISRTTVNEEWAVAAAFLRRELKAYRDTPSMGTN